MTAASGPRYDWTRLTYPLSRDDGGYADEHGWFVPLPVAASRTVKLGVTVATVGFPNIGLQGFAPKLAKGEIASLSGAGDDARHFQINVPVQQTNDDL